MATSFTVLKPSDTGPDAGVFIFRHNGESLVSTVTDGEITLTDAEYATWEPDVLRAILRRYLRRVVE